MLAKPTTTTIDTAITFWMLPNPNQSFWTKPLAFIMYLYSLISLNVVHKEKDNKFGEELQLNLLQLKVRSNGMD